MKIKIDFLEKTYIPGIFLVTASAIARLFKFDEAKYVFAFGALMVILHHLYLMIQTKEENFIKQRLMRIGLFSSLLLGLAAYSMFDNSDLWVPSILIYALITLYRSFRS